MNSMKRRFKTIGMMLISAGICTGTSPAAPIHMDGVRITQQSNICTGVVKDTSGEAVIGASITVKGTNNGAITDFNGSFSLQNVKIGDIIRISFVGYETKEMKWNGQAINVTLKDDTQALDEVVIIGYGAVRKADLAGSVAVMDSKTFRDQPVTRFTDALQGRAAGINVVSDGVPGGSVKIRIRGTNSINKSNEPLYVIDGMVRDAGLDGINPEDIRSMQILKDASSTAIYGSRGANGVIIVTTKGGIKGQTSLTLDASIGISNATNLPQMMDTQAYAQALVDYAGINANDLSGYLDGSNPGIDWTDRIFRTGITQNYKVVFAKGTEDLQTYISGNYTQTNGTIESNSHKRYAAKANIQAKMTDWLDVTFDVNASRGIGKGIGGLEMGGYNPLWIAFNSSPAMEMYDANGFFNKDPYGTIQNNAYGIISATEQERIRDAVNGHVDFRFRIVDGLTFTSTNGIDYYNNSNYSFTPQAVNGAGNNSMANNNTQRVLLQSSNNLTFIKDWNDKHHLTATAVWEATKNETKVLRANGSKLQVESVGWWDIQNASTRDVTNNFTDWALLSGVGRVIYNFDNRYMLTGTFRADGSSRFTNHKWGYFPSVAVAWTASNEKFMQKCIDTVNLLKIRASYGIIGNQDISPYSTLALMQRTTTYFGTTTGVTGYWANTLATPDIKWEKTHQFDLGLDLSLWNNRVNLTFDYFDKKTTDALLSTKLANYLGGTSYLINAGEVSNRGFDLSIHANIFSTKDFEWSTTLNGSYIRNKVEKLTAQEPVIYGGSFQSIITDCTIVKEGEAIGTFFGYEWAGIDSEGYDTYRTADGNATRTPTTDDRKVLGKASPDFTIGWNNSIRYKNWSLNAFFNSAFGAKRLNALRFAMNSMIGNSRMFTDAGYIDEIGKTMPDPSVANNQYIGNSTKWLENADYLRLENLSLAYDLPKDITKFADLRLSLSVQNLFTITAYKGSNPAGFSFSSDYGDRANGIDTGTYPTPRTFTFGIRMNL